MKLVFNKKIFAFIISFSFLAIASFADSSYTVKKGDTLYSISRKYQLTVAELRAANNLSESDVLKEGVKLVIPNADLGTAAALSSSKGADSKEQNTSSAKNNSQTSTTSSGSTTSSISSGTSASATSSYTVQKGDTLYGIARKFGIKLPELLSLNSLDTNATIKVGQKILVPSSVQNSSGGQKSSGYVKNTTSDSKENISDTKSKDYSGIVWPLSNPNVKNISGKVSGVQLTGLDNEKVKVVREGTVMYTGVYRGFGEVVFIQSKTGLIYSYSGLSKVSVKKGDYLVAGKEIGSVGKGNDSSMKFMVFQNGMPIDPAKAPRG